MLPKKNKKAEIDRGVLFTVGLVLALAATLVAFEWKTTPELVKLTGTSRSKPDQDIEIPPTGPDVVKPPSPAKLIDVIRIVANTIDTGINSDDLDTEAREGDVIGFEPADFGVVPAKEEEEDVILFAEQMPLFPGGDAALLQYIQRTLKYPVSAQENGIQGRVFVRFVIDRQGNVSNVELARGVDPLLDNEALRVIRSLPVWEPGRQQGKPVRVLFTVPIVFKLQ